MSKKAKQAARAAAKAAARASKTNSKNPVSQVSSPAKVVTPPVASITKPVISAPPVARAVISAPPAAAKKPVESEVEGPQLVVVSRVYDRQLNPLYARLRADDGTFYTASQKVAPIPPEGSKVIGEFYEYGGSTVVKVKNILPSGDPEIIQKREYVNSLPVYKLVNASDYYGSVTKMPENGDPEVVGTTPEGQIILFFKENRE